MGLESHSKGVSDSENDCENQAESVEEQWEKDVLNEKFQALYKSLDIQLI